MQYRNAVKVSLAMDYCVSAFGEKDTATVRYVPDPVCLYDEEVVGWD